MRCLAKLIFINFLLLLTYAVSIIIEYEGIFVNHPLLSSLVWIICYIVVEESFKKWVNEKIKEVVNARFSCSIKNSEN